MFYGCVLIFFLFPHPPVIRSSTIQLLLFILLFLTVFPLECLLSLIYAGLLFAELLAAVVPQPKLHYK